jgi:hypothetical protein
MHLLPIQLQIQRLRFEAFKQFFVDGCTHVDKVELVGLMLVSHALCAYPVFVVETEEFKGVAVGGT